MDAKRLIVRVGLGLIAVGILIGFVPVSTGSVSCGSAWHASNDAVVQDLTSTLSGAGSLFGDGHASDRCADSRQTERFIALGVIGVGSVLAFAAALAIGSTNPIATDALKSPELS